MSAMLSATFITNDIEEVLEIGLSEIPAKCRLAEAMKDTLALRNRLQREWCLIVTMRDVAEKADVSITTVSHVINKTRPVSDELRQRVLTAMKELEYQPNAVARSLRRKETHTLGMILPDSANPFFAEVARGIEDTGFKQGYSVVMCNSDADLDKENLYTNMLAAKRVDSILFVAAGESIEQIKDLQRRNIPVVVVDREIPNAVADMVLTDNAQGAKLATGHLIELGHRRIGCISGPSKLTPSAERVVGYRQVLAEYSIPPDEALIVQGDFKYESGYQATHQLLAMENPPSAIFACNDLMAIGAIRAAIESGRQVPDDLSIVGFDDIHLASFTNPPLTTVAQPKYEMGVVAATMLLERVRNEDMSPQRRLLDTRLLIRRSTVSL